MADGSQAVQGAIYTALNGNLTDLNSSAVGVYDHVPQDTTPAFVAIGEDSVSNSDTKTENGIEVDAEVHTYSSYRGLQEVKLIMGQVYDLLQRGSLTAVGFQITPPRLTFETSFIEPDGARGVQRFNMMVIAT